MATGRQPEQQQIGSVGDARSSVSGQEGACLPAGGLSRDAKLEAFRARAHAKRHTPGNCSRCGRPIGDAKPQAGAQGTCERCRAKVRAAKRRRLDREAIIAGETAIVDRETMASLDRRVRYLERRIDEMADYARHRYKAGYLAGIRRERREWADRPAPHDSWNDQLDITDKRMMSHVYVEA